MSRLMNEESPLTSGIRECSSHLKHRPSLSWHTLDTLSARQWHAVMALRQRVFVIEQRCFYLDADATDLDALHLLGVLDSGELVAYLRAYRVQANVLHTMKLGRVVIAPEYRGRGWGATLIHESHHELKRLGVTEMFLAAQVAVRDFYVRLGYEPYGEVFMDAEIPHIMMRSSLTPRDLTSEI